LAQALRDLTYGNRLFLSSSMCIATTVEAVAPIESDAAAKTCSAEWMKWMWGDAGGVGSKRLANVFLWSKVQNLQDTIAELKLSRCRVPQGTFRRGVYLTLAEDVGVPGLTRHLERPVRLEVFGPVQSEVMEFASVDAALSYLGGLEQTSN